MQRIRRRRCAASADAVPIYFTGWLPGSDPGPHYVPGGGYLTLTNGEPPRVPSSSRTIVLDPHSIHSVNHLRHGVDVDLTGNAVAGSLEAVHDARGRDNYRAGVDFERFRSNRELG